MNSPKKDPSESTSFRPRFDENGLIPCIIASARSGETLMLAWMNEEALEKTLTTGEVHYWSRSRKKLRHKGGTSGNVQQVTAIDVGCSQDSLLIRVEMPLPETACHTGRKSCFYRTLDEDGTLKFIKN